MSEDDNTGDDGGQFLAGLLTHFVVHPNADGADNDYQDFLARFMHAKNQPETGGEDTITSVLGSMDPKRRAAMAQAGLAYDPSLTDPTMRSAHSDLANLLRSYGGK